MIIFIAMPTEGCVLNAAIRPSILARIAKLHEEHPEHTFISPMINGYAIIPYLSNKSATWLEWGRYCTDLINVSDELWVLTIPKWEESLGVGKEIEYATKLNKPIKRVMNISHTFDSKLTRK